MSNMEERARELLRQLTLEHYMTLYDRLKKVRELQGIAKKLNWELDLIQLYEPIAKVLGIEAMLKKDLPSFINKDHQLFEKFGENDEIPDLEQVLYCANVDIREKLHVRHLVEWALALAQNIGENISDQSESVKALGEVQVSGISQFIKILIQPDEMEQKWISNFFRSRFEKGLELGKKNV